MDKLILRLGELKSVLNPWDPTQELTADVGATYYDKDGNQHSVKLALASDKKFLVWPGNMFQSTGFYPVTLTDSTGRSVVVPVDVLEMPTVPSLPTFSSCGGCGSCNSCNSSSNSETMKKLLEEKISTVESIKTSIDKSNSETKACIDDKIVEMNNLKFEFEKEISVKSREATLDAKTLLDDFSSDIKYLQIIKNELPSYKSIRDEMQTYKNNRKIIEDANKLHYNSLENSIKGFKDTVTELNNNLTQKTLEETEAYLYKKEVEGLRKDLECSQETMAEQSSEILKSFTEKVNDFTAFKISTLSKEKYKNDKKRQDEKIDKNIKDFEERLSDSENTISNLYTNEEFEKVQDDLAEVEDCCKNNKKALESLTLRVCEIEKYITELKKADVLSIVQLLKTAGIESILPNQLKAHFDTIKAGH